MSTIQDYQKWRYERKFFISRDEADRHEIENAIKLHPAMFSEIYYARHVNNMYLDSPELDNYADNLIGTCQRLKVRIRWYQDLFGLVKKPVLELKIKHGEIGTKHSYPLKPFRLDKNFTLDYLQEQVFENSGLPENVLESLKGLRFLLLNRYLRRYFLSADKKYRMTIDSGLEFCNIGPKNNSFDECKRFDDIFILELKYQHEHDDGVERITNGFPFRLTKSSKYVLGVDLFTLW